MRLIYLFCLLFVSVTAASSRFSSGENRTHLIELYSSEGCSSCPPAEAWIAGLAGSPKLWQDFVPVSFHVDYWDRLGWRDRFARAEFTTRQRDYAGLWGSDTVYTPEFVLDGQEWTSSFHRTIPSLSGEKAGILKVEYGEGGVCHVAFAGAEGVEVHVALLGGGIVSKVRAGENSGRQLHHEFVVLALRSVSLKDGTAEVTLPEITETGITRRALAVWVTRQGELAPMQATGGWLD